MSYRFRWLLFVESFSHLCNLPLKMAQSGLEEWLLEWGVSAPAVYLLPVKSAGQDLRSAYVHLPATCSWTDEEVADWLTGHELSHRATRCVPALDMPALAVGTKPKTKDERPKRVQVPMQ